MELLQLNEHLRSASLGYEYNELRSIYNDWSFDLHTKGNYMDNEILKVISINGLIKWYFKQISPFDVDYNFHNLKYLMDSPKSITFYDIKKISIFGNFFGINNDYIQNMNLNDFEYKFEYLFKKYKKNKTILNKYCTISFGNYISDKVGEDVFREYISNIYQQYIMYEKIFDNNALFDNFLKLYPKIIDWGIIYHKFKIVLEKLSCIIHKDIYIVDGFVDNIQQYIYTLIKLYIENILLNNSTDIYIKDEEKLYNDKYFKSYPDNILEHFDFTTII